MPVLPSDVGTGIVRVKLRQLSTETDASHTPTFYPVTGKVTFTPSATSLRHVGSGTIIPALPVTAYLTGDGDAVVTLMATDDAEIAPTAWTYEVSFGLDNGLVLAAFSISVPEGTDRELSDIAPLPAANGTFYDAQGPVGPQGPPGPPGPQGPPGDGGGGGGSAAVSTDPGNYAILGTDSLIYVPTPTTPVLAHSGLTGLTTGDDHTQYHNNTRGDVRYYTKSLADAAVATALVPYYTKTQVDANTYTRAQTDSAISAGIAAIPPSGAADVHVVLWTGSAYETLPGSPNPAWRVIEYRGPAVPTPPTAPAYASLQFDWRVRGA